MKGIVKHKVPLMRPLLANQPRPLGECRPLTYTGSPLVLTLRRTASSFLDQSWPEEQCSLRKLVRWSRRNRTNTTLTLQVLQ